MHNRGIIVAAAALAAVAIGCGGTTGSPGLDVQLTRVDPGGRPAGVTTTVPVGGGAAVHTGITSDTTSTTPDAAQPGAVTATPAPAPIASTVDRQPGLYVDAPEVPFDADPFVADPPVELPLVNKL